jgi:hypothetical protein
MKELEKYERDIEKAGIEAVEEKKQKQEITFTGSIRPLKGHTLFEINTRTLEVREASYNEHKRITWHSALRFLKGEISLNKEVIKNKDCIYISALNPTNALKRYREGKGSAKLNEEKSIL